MKIIHGEQSIYLNICDGINEIYILCSTYITQNPISMIWHGSKAQENDLHTQHKEHYLSDHELYLERVIVAPPHDDQWLRACLDFIN